MFEQHEAAAYLLERRLVSRRSVVSGRLRAPGIALTRARAWRILGARRRRDAAATDGRPCGGSGGGLAPGLLGGHAGSGLFYLRPHDDTVSSALLADVEAQ